MFQAGELKGHESSLELPKQKLIQSNEEQIWKTINNAGKNQIDPKWLKDNYSPNLSNELKRIITEQIGLLGKDGWTIIKFLLKQFGLQIELIYAAGLCHQPDAKDWLIMVLTNNEEFNVATLEALKCWGGSLSTNFFKTLQPCQQ